MADPARPFDQPESPPPALPGSDLRHLLGRRAWLPRLLAAALSGLLLSAAFTPLEWSWLAWIALIPLLLAPIPRRQRFLVGYVFGLAHFLTSLHWLNRVGFGAGYLLALACACFPAVWYWLTADLIEQLSDNPAQQNPLRPPFQTRLAGLPTSRFALASLAIPIFWVSIEWLRSWLFTGFPWNHLGTSQWQNLGLLQTTTFTGIYGISFLIATANLALLWIGCSRFRGRAPGNPRQFPWPVLLAMLLFLPPLWLARRPPALPPPDTTMRIAAIQGNLPQARVWSQEQLDTALAVYDRLTREEVARTQPDLVVWPETAIPAPAFQNHQYLEMLTRLVDDLRTPLLFGSIHRQMPVDDSDEYQEFNTVFLFGPDLSVEDYYYKIRLVPFGEFVPLGDVFPILYDLIGMGRDLTAGREFTLFRLNREVWAGVNICFEDVFPEVSRNFVRRGANLLMTLTNDSWFEDSAGSRQHMTHAVLRAVENRRPLLRSGNNSDTVLILPTGELRGLLYDDHTGERFIRAARTYDVPVWADLPTTFYTRHGDLFAWLCAAATLSWLLFRISLGLRRRHAARTMIVGESK